MTAQDLLKAVRERGLQVVVENGTPIIRKPIGHGGVTDCLRAALTLHREKIVEILTDPKGPRDAR